MKRDVRVTIGVLVMFIGICMLCSTYYNTKKLEVFDDMNEMYYEQILSVADDLMVDQVDDDDIQIDEDLIPDIEEDVVTTTVPVTQESDPNVTTTTTKPVTTTVDKSKQYAGILSIPNVDLKKGFYDINSKYNNLSNGLYVHPNSQYPDVNAGNLIIASHSGTASVALFKNLYKLNPADDVYVNYKNVDYHYKIKKIYKVPKTGTVSIQRNKYVSTLTLITCSKDDKTTQTVYICELVK